MSETEGPGVFISYSSQDRFIATMVAQHLRDIGYRPWVDFSGISGGDEWLARIHDALDRSRVCLVLLTPEAASSQWVQYEIERAQSANCPVIPLLFRTCELPEALQKVQYLDFRDDVDGSFKGLQRALTTALWRSAGVHDSAELKPTPTPPPPITPAQPVPLPGPMGYGSLPGAMTLSPLAIEKSQPVERIVTTSQSAEDALDSARLYLTMVGFRLKRSEPVLVYGRGSEWLSLLIQSPRNVRRTFTLAVQPPGYGPHTQIHVTFEVFCPPGWTINSQERSFWRAEISELETALLSGEVSRRESSAIEKEMMPRVVMISLGLIFLFFVATVLLLALLNLIFSTPAGY